MNRKKEDVKEFIEDNLSTIVALTTAGAVLGLLFLRYRKDNVQIDEEQLRVFEKEAQVVDDDGVAVLEIGAAAMRSMPNLVETATELGGRMGGGEGRIMDILIKLGINSNK